MTRHHMTDLRTSPAGSPAKELVRLLEAELARFPSLSGIYAKHLRSGEDAAVAADARFDSMSTIKIAIMALAYRLADQQCLDLDTRYLIQPEDFRPASGIFQFHDFGLSPTLRDIILQMIITSDNIATDIILQKVGGVAEVNRFLAQNGFAALHLNRTMCDYYRQRYELLRPDYSRLSAEDIFAIQSELPHFTQSRHALIRQVDADIISLDHQALMRDKALVEDHWMGVATPRDMARMLEQIETDIIASVQSCAEMRRVLRRQQHGKRKIPHHLTVPVAHKTGEKMGVTNDVGIVYARSGPIIIASYNMNMTGPHADGDDRIGHVARLIVDYFDGRHDAAPTIRESNA